MATESKLEQREICTQVKSFGYLLKNLLVSDNFTTVNIDISIKEVVVYMC